jgi:hypothetical protein
MDFDKSYKKEVLMEEEFFAGFEPRTFFYYSKYELFIRRRQRTELVILYLARDPKYLQNFLWQAGASN